MMFFFYNLPLASINNMDNRSPKFTPKYVFLILQNKNQDGVAIALKQMLRVVI